MTTVIHALISLLPVLAFLGGLVLVDSYKLVRPKAIGMALVAGFIAAGAAYLVNGWLLDTTSLSFVSFSRYVAPLSEEALKCIWVIYLIRRARIGFAVDAAVTGFAVGAGFAVLENLYFLSELNAGIQTWVVRGFGTAIMHGVTTTIFAVICKTLQQNKPSISVLSVGASLLFAYVFHSVYNHFPFPPLVSTSFLVLTAPVVVMLIFERSEKFTRRWLGTGFDTDQELLAQLMDGSFSTSPVGRFLTSLKETVDGKTVADMFCLIQLRVELSIRAKGILLMREAGFEPKPDPSVQAKFVEIKYLENEIGKAGLMAIEPVHKWSKQDLWQLNMLMEQDK